MNWMEGAQINITRALFRKRILWEQSSVRYSLRLNPGRFRFYSATCALSRESAKNRLCADIPLNELNFSRVETKQTSN